MSNHRPHPHAGFSLVELLVATAIGLLTVLAIMQSLSAFEGIRRNASGSGNNQVNATLSLYAVERDLRMAGYGLIAANGTGSDINPDGVIGICGSGTVYAYSSKRPNGQSFQYKATTVPFLPFTINPAGIPAGETGDVLAINYAAGSGMVTDRLHVTLDLVPPTATVDSRAGLHTGELAVLVGPPGSAYCDMVEITKLPNSGMCSDTAGSTTEVLFANTGTYASYWNATTPGNNCSTIAPVYNDPAGVSSLTYNTGRIVTLGRREDFVSKIYAVRGGSLRVCNMLTHDCTHALATLTTAELLDYWKPIAFGVVAFRVEYTTSTGAAGTWTQAAPTNWTLVKAARIVIVTRSDQRERDSIAYTATSIPDDTGKAPYGAGTGITVGTDVSKLDLTTSTDPSAPVGDWQHYRYKLVESTFVFPNLIGAKQLTAPPN